MLLPRRRCHPFLLGAEHRVRVPVPQAAPDTRVVVLTQEVLEPTLIALDASVCWSGCKDELGDLQLCGLCRCWTFLCPHITSQDCCRALLRCWVWSRVAAGLLLPLPAPTGLLLGALAVAGGGHPCSVSSRGWSPTLTPPQGCAFCLGTWAPGLGPGLGFSPAHGVFRLLSGHVLPAARDDGAACDGAACVLPALPPSSPPHASSPVGPQQQARLCSPLAGAQDAAAQTKRMRASPAPFLPPPPNAPRDPALPAGLPGGQGTVGSPGSAPPFHPCARMRPPSSPQLLPNCWAQHWQGGG